MPSNLVCKICTLHEVFLEPSLKYRLQWFLKGGYMLHSVFQKKLVFLLFTSISWTLHACTAEIELTTGTPKGMVRHQTTPLYNDLEFKAAANNEYTVYTAFHYRRQIATFNLDGTLGSYELKNFNTTIEDDREILDLREAIEQRIIHWNQGMK